MLKKLLTTLAIVPFMASLVSVNLVQAAGTPTFNNLNGDQEFMQGRNVTTNGNFMDPVAANANQEVDVAVYYHNTVVDSTATNTKIKVTIPTNLAKTHVLTGAVSADNASTTNGTVINGQQVGNENLTINSDGNTKVDFVKDSLRWYPDRSATTGAGSNLPGGQTGNEIMTTGITIGDIKGCFQYSGFVIFRVKLTGVTVTPTPTPTPTPKTTLAIDKLVRKANTSDAFVDKTLVTPGNEVEYKITVRNLDGVVAAKNLKIEDVLPKGITYVGPTIAHLPNGTTQTLSNDLGSKGYIIISELKAREEISIHFLAKTDKSAKNAACVVNTVKASAENTNNTPTADAEVCFIVATEKPTPTPKTPNVIPTPELPRTGPELPLLLVGGLTGLSAAVRRKMQARKGLRDQLNNLDIR